MTTYEQGYDDGARNTVRQLMQDVPEFILKSRIKEFWDMPIEKANKELSKIAKKKDITFGEASLLNRLNNLINPQEKKKASV